MKHSLIHLTALLVVLTTGLGAQVNVDLEKGDKAFDQLQLDEALFFYENAYEQQGADPAITRRIANTYRRMGQLTVSAEWYRRTLDLDATNPDDMLYYAESLKSLEQYDEAIQWYERYITQRPEDKRAKSHLADKEYYLDMFADTARYDMKRLNINSSDPVIGICHLEGNRYLLSAINAAQVENKSRKTNHLQYLDIYEVTLNESNELVNPVRLSGSVNSKYHDGPAYYSAVDQTLYFTRNNIRKGKPVLDKKGLANLKIYSALRKGNDWSGVGELKINSDDYSSAHACLSRDGQFMYFVSNRDGGFGGTDLYVAQKMGDQWTTPINLGPNVNTEGNEMFPMLATDGRLYFTSDGHAGLGGTDIFVSENASGTWLKPQNMGAPINSNYDDFTLLYDKESDVGFFCSNRSGRGNDDIFLYTHKPIDYTILAGSIVSTESGISLAGERIRIRSLTTGKIEEQVLSSDQKFFIPATPGDRIEVTMADGQRFDPNKVIFSSEIPKPVLDPMVPMGEFRVIVNKIAPRDAELTQGQGAGLAKSGNTGIGKGNNGKSGNTTTAQGKTNEGAGKTDTQKPDPTLNKTDNSTLILTNTEGKGTAEKERLVKENIALGDQLFQRGDYEASSTFYKEALKQAPNDAHSKERLAEIERIRKGEPAAKQTKEDPRDQPKNQPVEPSKTTPANKPKVDFESTPALIDLEGLQVNNIVFEYNKAFIRESDKPNLDKVTKLLKDNPTSKILIKAYCDSRGSSLYNEQLSMSRAMAVQGYLIQKGISRDRIQTEWYGEQRPLNDCVDDTPCTEEEYEVNRRAEIKIVAGSSPTK
ncbi:MAG: OmpA family protein [Flavobacteriales bacterium]|jgi:outer membrane protein OmpA-like peptidoglycan-associated protein